MTTTAITASTATPMRLRRPFAVPRAAATALEPRPDRDRRLRSVSTTGDRPPSCSPNITGRLRERFNQAYGSGEWNRTCQPRWPDATVGVSTSGGKVGEMRPLTVVVADTQPV